MVEIVCSYFIHNYYFRNENDYVKLSLHILIWEELTSIIVST